MTKEADFYSPQEASKILAIPERRVFAMVCGGELEGHQDEWARWWIPAGALHARRESGYSSEPDGSTGDGAGSHEDEARGDATTTRNDRAPLREPPSGASEETTQVAGEALIGDDRTSSRARVKSSEEETARRLPRDAHQAVNPGAASGESAREFASQLAAAEAEAGELRNRLRLAEATENTLRESLERERLRVHWLKEELRAERAKGFWQKLSGG